MQVVQLPALQTAPAPHAVPLASAVPLSVQTAAPLAQTIAPVWQALVTGVHAVPAVQATQLPPGAHTRLVPHDLPAAAAAPVSTQTGAPVAHDVVPTWHVLAGVHAAPSVQAPQLPALQNELVPHERPLGALAPVSTQTLVPVAHEVVPTWQIPDAAVGVQASPAWHVVHVPALQTRLVPQVVPSPTLVAASLQIATPVEQSVVPAWQAFAP
jgi:hypothetical protein